jgi:hypothetical protein
MTEKDKAFMRRAIELSAKTSLVVKAGGVFGTVIVDKHGHVRQSPVRPFVPVAPVIRIITAPAHSAKDSRGLFNASMLNRYLP